MMNSEKQLHVWMKLLLQKNTNKNDLELKLWNIKGKRLSVSNLLSGDSEINYIYIKW